MNENLIPEYRELTMVEELWPVKKYEGNRPVWDCRNWLVEAIQGEILDHVRRYPPIRFDALRGAYMD